MLLLLNNIGYLKTMKKILTAKLSLQKKYLVHVSGVLVIVMVMLFSTASNAKIHNSEPIAETLAMPYGSNLSQTCATLKMNAALDYVRLQKWNVTVVVVDTAGQTIVLSRMDNAHKASPDFAIAKASSAVLTKRSTKIFSDSLSEGRNAILGFIDLHVHPAEGGEIIVQNGRIVGAIGVAGMTEQQDRKVALVGVKAKCS